MSSNVGKKSIPESLVDGMLENQYFRFKPKHTALLNDVANVFGYNNFTELNNISKSQDPSNYLTMGDSDYSELVIEVFVKHFLSSVENAGFKHQQISSVSYIRDVSRLAINAWELNKNLVEQPKIHAKWSSKRSGGAIKDTTLDAADALWRFSSEYLGEYLVVEDKTYKGSLLPVIGYHLHSTSLSFTKKKYTGILFKVGEARIKDSNIDLQLLPQHHALEELIKSDTRAEITNLFIESNNTYSSALLAFLSQFNEFHRSYSEKAEWFLKPHNKDDWNKIFKLEQTHHIKMGSDGVYRYEKI